MEREKKHGNKGKEIENYAHSFIAKWKQKDIKIQTYFGGFQGKKVVELWLFITNELQVGKFFNLAL